MAVLHEEAAPALHEADGFGIAARDEHLPPIQMVQKIIAAAHIELAHHVVEQNNRALTGFLEKNVGLRKLQSQYNAALLSLRAVGARRQAVDLNGKVVPVRSGTREARADIRALCAFQRGKELCGDFLPRIRTAERRIGKGDALFFLRDAAVDLRSLRRERAAERDALQNDLGAEEDQPLIPNVERVAQLRMAQDIL